MSLSLLGIETALTDLFETREELLNEAAFTPEQIEHKAAAIAEVETAIKQYVAAEIQKVDNISRWLIEMKLRRGALDEEIDRLTGLRNSLENNEKQLKEIVLTVMQQIGEKKLTGRTGTLRRQANGGVRVVEVVQPDLVTGRHQKITITMPAGIWFRICESADLSNEEIESMHMSETVPDLAAIRKALESGQGVPGCRLAERGEHVRVG